MKVKKQSYPYVYSLFSVKKEANGMVSQGQSVIKAG
jgi:hypothetical protein